MDKHPEALRLADLLERGWLENVDRDAVDVGMIQEELRRLHQSETEGWRWAKECEAEVKRVKRVNQELVEALETIAEYWDQDTNHDAMQDACYYMEATARVALAKATGEQA